MYSAIGLQNKWAHKTMRDFKKFRGLQKIQGSKSKNSGNFTQQIETTIELPFAIKDVFPTIVNAAYWVYWHPATQRVVGPARPMQAGDHIIEYCTLNGRQYDANWTVVSVERDQGLELSAKSGRVVITYVFTATSHGCRFTRVLKYDPSVFADTPGAYERLEAYMREESRIALERLAAWLQETSI